MLGVILRRRYVFLAYIQGGGFTWSEVWRALWGGYFWRGLYSESVFCGTSSFIVANTEFTVINACSL